MSSEYKSARTERNARMAAEEEPPIKGVFLSKNEDNGKEAMIAFIRLHLPYEDPAQLALRGCAFRIIKPNDNVEHPNTVLVGGGRETSHNNLRANSYELTKGNLSVFENPNVIQGFYTYSGFFVPRDIAMWCALHIEGGLKDGWSRRSAFSELQSDGVIWDAHKEAWQYWQKELAETKQ